MTENGQGSGQLIRPLIVGADGLIGRALSQHFAAAGVPALETNRRSGGGRLVLDLAALPADWAPPAGIDAAFLCAAVTSEATCRDQPELARRVNVEATIELARRLTAGGAFVVLLSSSLVFDGRAPQRQASEPTAPGNFYGSLKAEAEAGILALDDPAFGPAFGAGVAVVRMTKIIGADTALLRGWIEALKRQEVVRPFDDMVFAPLSAAFTAAALGRVAATRTCGILHLSAAADISYADAARHIARRLGVPAERVQPVSRRSVGIPDAVAPAHTTLAIAATERGIGLTAPDPFAMLDDCLGFSRY